MLHGLELAGPYTGAMTRGTEFKSTPSLIIFIVWRYLAHNAPFMAAVHDNVTLMTEPFGKQFDLLVSSASLFGVHGIFL